MAPLYRENIGGMKKNECSSADMFLSVSGYFSALEGAQFTQRCLRDVTFV